jgi:hypothetical protein
MEVIESSIYASPVSMPQEQKELLDEVPQWA